MRILLVTIGSLLVSLMCFWIVKFWGRSQVYPEYQHAMYLISPGTVEFAKPSFQNLENDLKNQEFLFLEVVITMDQKLVMLRRRWTKDDKSVRYSLYDDIKKDLLNLQDYKDILKNKKIIFSLVENSQAAHENFFYNMQQLGLEKGENFIVTSPYEAPIKALKELAPSFVYATTQPEILKIVAMGSMHLFEAANIRADIILHPLKIRNQIFYTEDLLTELARRHKRIIVGPITAAEKDEAVKLNPYGLVIED